MLKTWIPLSLILGHSHFIPFPASFPFSLMLCLTQNSKRGSFEVIYTTGFMEWEALSPTGQVKMLLLSAQGRCKTYWAMNNYWTIFKISYKDQNRTKPEWASEYKNKLFVVGVVKGKRLLNCRFSDVEANFCSSLCPSHSVAWCLAHGRHLKIVFGLMNHTNHCCLRITGFSRRDLVWILKQPLQTER